MTNFYCEIQICKKNISHFFEYNTYKKRAIQKMCIYGETCFRQRGSEFVKELQNRVTQNDDTL